MLHKRTIFLKWTSIIIAYTCIFLLSYEFGTSRRHYQVEQVTHEPRHITMKRLFYDHVEYLNSSMVLKMINKELRHSLPLYIGDTNNRTKLLRHALVVFYDFSNHHLFFQQFLWLYTSWIQLRSHSYIQHDLVLFVSSTIIPNDFIKLKNHTKSIHNKNEFIIYSCTTLIDSILNKNYEILNNFPIRFHMELGRLFYWHQTRLSSLLLFLINKYRNKLLQYDYIFRLDVDSFLMSNFCLYQQTSSLILGEAIPYNQYTLNRLERIQKYFNKKSNSKIMAQSITISWFGRLHLISKLARQIVLMAAWLMKEEFTESERLHHLTYLSYPSWYIDGIFEYATAVILSLNQFEKFYQNISYQFDCRHLLTSCLHISLRDPSHHVHLSKHSLYLLTNINQSNLTNHELYIYRAVIRSNGMFRQYFS